MSNIIVPTKLSIITSLHDVVKLMRRLTLLGLKPSRVNLASIHSNIQTARANIKQILLTILSRSISLTKNGIPKKLKFKKIKNNQFIYL